MTWYCHGNNILIACSFLIWIYLTFYKRFYFHNFYEIQVRGCDGNPGEIDFGSSYRKVRVSEGSSKWHVILMTRRHQSTF